MIRLGAALPNAGPRPGEIGLGVMAERLEAAGFESLWVGDHVLTPAEPRTPYPYASSGTMLNDPVAPWYDSIVAMTVAAACTTRCEIGVGVLVLPLRRPEVVGKQLASLDAVAGGRLVLGVGAGWMREEFEALGADFDRRGRALEEGVATLRRMWTGRLGDMICRPVPARPIPVLIGGMTALACHRAGRIGDGWYAVQRPADLDPGVLAAQAGAVQAAAGARGPVGRLVLRIPASAGEHARIGAVVADLAGAGITEIVVDVPWDDADGPAATFRALDTARRRVSADRPIASRPKRPPCPG